MKRITTILHALLLQLHDSRCVATQMPWTKFIYSPDSRTVAPASVHSTSGHVVATQDSEYSFSMSPGSHVSLDFGIEVGGYVSFNIESTAEAPQLSLAFAESSSFVRTISDDTGAVVTENYDLALNVSVPVGSSFYTMPLDRFRGGFRFVTVNAYEQVSISNITCEIGFAPGTTGLRNYSGYFYTPNDDVLVRSWYAGAYTVQTNIGPQNTGRYLPQVKPGWAYNASLGVPGPILLDGAKRDRAVWPGDIGLSGTTASLALGPSGLEAVKNALETLFYYQNSSTGRFPFAGPDTASFRSGSQSDTYHAWSLISIYNYAIFTGDVEWLQTHWSNITYGVDFIITALDNGEGLHNQTATNDWGRQGSGGYNSALNALDYHALSSFAGLASTWTKNDTVLSKAAQWSAAAGRLKASYNVLLWSPELSLFRDNQSTTLAPQDGNSLALLYNLTESSEQASSLSSALTEFWTPIGPVTPELPDTISPFVSSLEVLAHLTVNQPFRALDLLRRHWTYLLGSPLMTGSTLAEGITANGSLYYRGNAGYNHDAAYTSLSHGWSSGPTQALTFKVAGLELVGWYGWRFKPHSGGLKIVKSGYESPIGGFAVSWEIEGDVKGQFEFTAQVTTPTGTTGSVELPWNCKDVWVNREKLSGRVQGGTNVEVRGLSCSE